MSYKLLEIGCLYELISLTDPPVIENITKDELECLGVNDPFLVLDSKVEFLTLSKLTKGNIIKNKILMYNQVYIFWYWEDSDFYFEIEKFIQKIC